jgi:hypothetical protein
MKIGISILGINAQFDDLLNNLGNVFPFSLYLMRKNTTVPIESQPLFRRNIPSPFSELSNPGMKEK